MFKKIFFLIVFLLSVCSLSARDSADTPIISVLDFTVNNVSESDMNSIINLLSSALFRTGKYTVIDVSQRAAILSEMEFSNSGCTDESCQLEIGKLLSAEMIVTGDLAQVGSRYLFTAKLLETETGKTLVTADGVYGNLDELIDDLGPFAVRLATGEESEGPAPVVEVSETEPAAEGVDDTQPSVSVEPEETGDRAQGKVSGRRIAAFATLAGGVIAGGVGGYLFYDAFAYNTEYVTPAWEAYDNGIQGADFDSLREAYENYYDEFETKLITGGAVAGGGLLLLGVSAVLFLAPEKVKENTDVVVLTDPLARTAILSFHVSL